MKSLFLLFLLAQTTRKEITTPGVDTQGLNPAVPDVIAISTQFERVLLLRFKNETDLLAGLEKQLKAQKIENAVILSGIGSVTSTHYHVVSNRSFPSKNLFVETPIDSADVVTVSGMVLKGKLHAHILFANGERAFGGHLEPRTKVFTFAAMTIGVLPASIDISRFDDKTLR